MWGALVFLAFFLVIAPSTREVILGLIEQARLRVAVEAPLSYFLVVVLGGSAIVSALIMKFWPAADDKQPQVRILHQYQGRAATDFASTPRRPAVGFRLLLELAWVILPVQTRSACRRLLGHVAASAHLKRLPGA